MTRPILHVLAALALPAGVAFHGGRAEAAKAPEVKPTEWLNAKGATSWDTLKGRLILVEKWATW